MPMLTVKRPSTQQEGEPVPIRGTAQPGAAVTVAQDDGQQRFALADADGNWGAIVIAPAAGTHTLSASTCEGTATTTYSVRSRAS
jgi:hypothetical protein